VAYKAFQLIKTTTTDQIRNNGNCLQYTNIEVCWTLEEFLFTLNRKFYILCKTVYFFYNSPNSVTAVIQYRSKYKLFCFWGLCIEQRCWKLYLQTATFSEITYCVKYDIKLYSTTTISPSGCQRYTINQTPRNVPHVSIQWCCQGLKV